MSTDNAGEVQSRQNKGKAYPNPEPQRPISARLEHVRTEKLGYKSKRAFWQALTEDGEYEVSYEAVRNYHYNREPPPSYLARVAEVFDVRLGWLIAGRGEITPAGQASRIVSEATSGGALPGPPRPDAPALDSHTTAALLAAWRTLAEAHGGGLGEIVYGGTYTLSRYTWEKLQAAADAPLETLEEFLGPADDEAKNDYLAAVALAIRRYARAAGPPEEPAEQGTPTTEEDS